MTIFGRKRVRIMTRGAIVRSEQVQTGNAPLAAALHTIVANCALQINAGVRRAARRKTGALAAVSSGRENSTQARARSLDRADLLQYLTSKLIN